MTRERAKELAPIIKAYADGIELEEAMIGYEDWYHIVSPNFENELYKWRIRPTPKKRPMTRGEVLYMVTTTQGMVVIQDYNDKQLFLPEYMINKSLHPLEYMHWLYAIIDRHGNPIDGWHTFEVEE